MQNKDATGQPSVETWHTVSSPSWCLAWGKNKLKKPARTTTKHFFYTEKAVTRLAFQEAARTGSLAHRLFLGFSAFVCLSPAFVSMMSVCWPASVSLSACLPVCVPRPVCLCLSFRSCRPFCLCVYLASVSVSLSLSLSVCVCLCLTVCLSVC